MIPPYAPPATVVDGLTVVPIDITHVDATVVFNATTHTATVSATMSFLTGDSAGCPAFDLRQTPLQVSLDGIPIPVADVAHHDMGVGMESKMRVLARTLPAGTAHALAFTYELHTPDSSSAQPVGWAADGQRVSWDLYSSDLKPARYLEMWFPSNLVYDTFALTLDVSVVGTEVTHTALSNGAVASLGTNRWRVDFPAHFAPFAHAFLLQPADQITTRTASVTLPGSPTPVDLTLARPSSLTSVDLVAQEALLRSDLTFAATELGPYDHGTRFLAWYWAGSRSMEYNGATTTATGAQRHEVFHSWIGRSVRPATQNDSWLDEALTTWATSTPPFKSAPFNFADPPTLLRPEHPWSRVTPGNAYSDGAAVFEGLAATLGVATLRAHIKAFYASLRGAATTTAEVEAFLVRETGRVDLLDAFQRFVHGHGALPGPARPDLYLRDAADDLGANAYPGSRFWDSPDLWVRNADDLGTAHQNPISGQDNWLYARVRNRGTATARTYAVTFTAKTWAGSQFIYPEDYSPCTAAVVAYGLAPGTERIVRARWPAALVPPAGTHACLLGRVYTPDEAIPAGPHVWEHNNLAQKNLTIVDAAPDTEVILPFRVGAPWSRSEELVRVEIRRPPRWESLRVDVLGRTPAATARILAEARHPPVATVHSPPEVVLRDGGRVAVGAVHLRLGPGSTFLAGSPPAAPIADLSRNDLTRVGDALALAPGSGAGFALFLRPRSQQELALRLRVPSTAPLGSEILVDVIQRAAGGAVVGGVSVMIRVRGR